MKKVIWITGGSSGIGKAVALKFANKGWQVIISSRREEVLKDISDNGDPLTEILKYVQKKLTMSKTKKQESKLFATEILHGAPLTQNILAGSLKETVDDKVKLLNKWISEEKIAPVDPYHLIFSIWSMTQHYADFDVQVYSLLNTKKRSRIFQDAEDFLLTFFTRCLKKN